MLKLTSIVGPEADATESRRAATATSAIDLIRTKHLQRRKAERGIDTRALQAAIKHGAKAPGNQPNTVKHAHGSVHVVTAGSKENLVGITAYKKQNRRMMAPPVPKFD
eukprot:SAG31_NODE_14313_length_815_cov_0.966480_1_plen_108_part_00